MVTQIISRMRTLWLFAFAATLLISLYILLLASADEKGSTGLYIVPALFIIVCLYVLIWLLIIVSIILYRRRNRSARSLMFLILSAFLLFIPTLLGLRSPQIFQKHMNTLVTPGHVYQLSEGIFSFSCPDTFDVNTYTCFSGLIIYQCDRLGLLCSMKTKDIRFALESTLDETSHKYIQRDYAFRLELVDHKLQVISNQNKVIYSMPV